MLSIIVLSSDGYSDCWNPFFTLLKKNFPESDKYEIILSTNSKEFEFSGLNIKTLLNGNDTPWSKRLKLSLDYASNEIVMVLVEDFFLLSKLNYKVFEKLLYTIINTRKIGHIRLLYKLDEVKTQSSKYEYLDEIKQNSKFRFLYLPGLWKKSILERYVVDYETPYMAERMGDVRSWILKDGFFAVSNNYIEKYGRLFDCGTSGAIIKGKWGKWLPERLEENGISIDLKVRGFKDSRSNKKANTKIYINLILNIKTSFKSIRSILILFLRSLITNNNRLE